MKALIIANGTLPPRRLVRDLAKSADVVVCADGGANHARRMRVTPDVIVGDLDSVTSSIKKYFHRVPLIFVDDQDSTDLEKALEFCVQRRFKSVDVVGAIGDRLDHTTGSLGCFKKYGEKIELRLFDTVAAISLIRKKAQLLMRIGEKFSLIPLERCEGVTTKNLKYALRNEILELGVREGISNEALARDVSINVKRGTLLLYRFLKMEKRVES